MNVIALIMNNLPVHLSFNTILNGNVQLKGHTVFFFFFLVILIYVIISKKTSIATWVIIADKKKKKVTLIK